MTLIGNSKVVLEHRGGLCWCGDFHPSRRQSKAVVNQVPRFLRRWLVKGIHIGGNGPRPGRNASKRKAAAYAASRTRRQLLEEKLADRREMRREAQEAPR